MRRGALPVLRVLLTYLDNGLLATCCHFASEQCGNASEGVVLIETAGLSNRLPCRVAPATMGTVYRVLAFHDVPKGWALPEMARRGRGYDVRSPSRGASQATSVARLAIQAVGAVQPLHPRPQAGRAQAAAVVGVGQAVDGQRRQRGAPARGIQRLHHAAGKVGAATAACAHRYPFENGRENLLVRVETPCCNLSDIRPFFTEKSAGDGWAFVVKSRPSLNLEQS